jgi:probable HAF family extracellular repeat protein
MSQIKNHRLTWTGSRMKLYAFGLGLTLIFCTRVWAQRESADTFKVSEPITYTFQTVNFPNDTFTQLLGINDSSVIAGYHGSGAAGSPNQGFTLVLPNTFTNENYPQSAQTQVIGINNSGTTDGFYIDSASVTHAFIDFNNTFSTVTFDHTTFNQLLGVNNLFQTVGYWQNTSGTDFAYIWAQNGGVFLSYTIPNAASAQATGINDKGESCGFYIDKSMVSHGFTLNSGTLTVLNFPDATATSASGVNNKGEVVGFYVDSAGLTHGFIYAKGTFHSLDDPNGVGATIINGINTSGQIVGFYGPCVTGGTTCNGFVGTP